MIYRQGKDHRMSYKELRENQERRLKIKLELCF